MKLISRISLVMVSAFVLTQSVKAVSPPPQVSSQVYGASFSYPATPDYASMLPWSDPNAWNTGAVPSPGEAVVIPEGSAVYIDEDIDVQSITVMGQLVVSPELEHLEIFTEYIMIMGEGALFEWGYEDEPFLGTGVLTLVGEEPAIIPNTSSFPPENSKGIMVMNYGVLHIHGLERKSWTVLNETAREGESHIVVEGQINTWFPGDEIVVATSTTYDFDLHDFWGDDQHLIQSERRTVTAVTPSGGNTIVEFSPELGYDHYGELQTYSNSSQTWTLDERTEVGLLTRNILIQGDDSSEDTHHGGHIMIMKTAEGYISGAEFYRMGQQEFKARYPFHWHLAKDVSGQYLTNCSLHDLYFRAVTIHGTQNALVSDNVVFETQGHGIFFEDAVEQGNVVDGNLVINVRRPPLGIGANSFIGSDRGVAHIRARGPGAFWITNPDNTITNNHVAGVQGIAFWYGMPSAPTGPSANDPDYTGLQPDRIAIKEFNNNTAHGAMTGFHQDHKNSDTHPDGIIATHYFLNNLSWQEVNNFTAYHCYRGWWARTVDKGIDFKNTILADCLGQGMTVTASKGRSSNSLFVGHSNNSPMGIGSTTHFQNQALSLYDGYMAAYDCHFADFDYTYQSVFAMIGGRTNRSNNVFTGCTFTSNSKLYDPEITTPITSRLLSVAHDVDGVYTSPWGAVCVYHPFMVGPNHFTIEGNAKSYKTDEHFAALSVYHNYSAYTQGGANTNPDAGNQYMEWDDGHCLHGDERLQDKSQWPVVPNIERRYKLRMLEGVPAPLDIHLNFAENGDVFDLQIQDSPSQLTISSAQGYAQKTSEAQVWNSTTKAYHWDATTGTLSIRMIASGAIGTGVEEKLTATATVQILGGTQASLLARDSRPFGGTYREEDTKIEAEWFDYGGQDVAYFKILPPEMVYFFTQFPVLGSQKENLRALNYGRRGELLRLQEISSNEYAVQDIDATETIKYTFYSKGGITSDFRLNYALASVGSIEVFVNGVAAWTSAQSLPATGGLTTFSTEVLSPVSLSKGVNVVEIKSNCTDLSIDWFSIGTPTVVNPPAPICKTSTSSNFAAIELEMDASIYPNPADEYVHIDMTDLEGEWLLQVSDLAGRIMHSGYVETEADVNVAKYTSGAYIFSLTSANGEQKSYTIYVQ